MDGERCRGCGTRQTVMGTVLSAHRTSEGTVVYHRCRCGRAGVRLVRPWSAPAVRPAPTAHAAPRAVAHA